MAKQNTPASTSLSKKQSRLAKRLARRVRKWVKGVNVRETVRVGRIAVVIRGRVHWNGQQVVPDGLLLTIAGKGRKHKQALDGPLGVGLKGALADRGLAGSISAELGKLWTKAERQMAETLQGVAKLADRLKMPAEKVLADYVCPVLPKAK